MSIMIVSTSIVTGFKKEISEKVFGFWGHVHISNNYAASSLSFESSPVNARQSYYESLDTIGKIQYVSPSMDGVATIAHNATFPLFWFLLLGIVAFFVSTIIVWRKELSNRGKVTLFSLSIGLILLGIILHPIQIVETESLVETEGGIKNIQQYASKEGIIKTKKEIEGIILRGVSQDFNFSYLNNNLIKGTVLDFKADHDILISKNTADRLLLDVGDSFLIYFVQNEQSLARRLYVKGIFKTGLEEYDKRFAVVNISLIQELNNWRPFRYYGEQYWVNDGQLQLRSIESLSDSYATALRSNMDSFQLNLLKDSSTNYIILPRKVSESTGIQLGDSFLINFTDQEGDSCSYSLVVLDVHNESLASNIAYVSWHTMQYPNEVLSPQISGFEVFVENFKDIDAYSEFINFQVLLGQMQYGTSIKDLEPNIFDWLSLTDTNERVILIFMLLVCIINMITSLLILILERTNMIGILKSLGATEWNIRTIFLYNAGYIVCLGLFLGNLLGFGFCWLQKTFGLIKLPEELYYISVAPIELNIPLIIVLNIGTFILTLFFLIVPTWIVSTLDPVKSIRFN